MLTSKVTPDGRIHLATDSESYASEMMQYLSDATGLKTVTGQGIFASIAKIFLNPNTNETSSMPGTKYFI